MAVPKKKKAKGASLRRRGGIKLNKPNLVVCKSCGKKKKSHRACPDCGSTR